MKTIAVYSLKGGVGKTTLAVNLACASAGLSSRRTLLWDLDAQAAASFLLGADLSRGRQAQAVFSKELGPEKLIRPSPVERLDLLPADASLRSLDRFFSGLGKKRRLARLLETMAASYDRIVLDAPPGLTETSEQVLRAADIIVVPVIPSPLSMRALDEVVTFLDRHSLRRGPILPVYNMVDRRRALHRAAVEAKPDWPLVPMVSALEAMTADRGSVGRLPPASPAGRAVAGLWQAIERRLERSG